jgi:hypothetical protein
VFCLPPWGGAFQAGCWLAEDRANWRTVQTLGHPLRCHPGGLNASSAQSTSSYSLATILTNKRQKSRSVSLSQAEYNAVANTVMLVTRKPLAPTLSLRLTYRLLETNNRPLSGVARLSKKWIAF